MRLLTTIATLGTALSSSAAAYDDQRCDATSLITKHEGSKRCAYTDTTGHRTVGVGFNMDAVSSSTWSSILPDAPYHAVYSGESCLEPSQIQTLLQYSLKGSVAEAGRVVSNYQTMCCGVQNVVTDMTFNLGSLSGFPTLVRYFEQGDYSAAADDMRSTLWCQQVGSRCVEDAAAVGRGCGGQPTPSGGGCKSCIEGGGGMGCASKCGSCGSSCVSCVGNGGGKGCLSRCCDEEEEENFSSLLDSLVREARQSKEKTEQKAAWWLGSEGAEKSEEQCCFCMNGGDGSGGCLEVQQCRAKGGGYKCGGGGDGGCKYYPTPPRGSPRCM